MNEEFAGGGDSESDIEYQARARRIYVDAAHFEPVFAKQGLDALISTSNELIGWTFSIPVEGSIARQFSWITSEGQVSKDPLPNRGRARKSIRAHVASLLP